MNIVERAKLYRVEMQNALSNLDEAKAIESPDLYDKWKEGMECKINIIYRVDKKLYRCLQTHTAQADYEPSKTPSLFKKFETAGGVPVWSQPVGAMDAYKKGDKVTHKGKVWVSDVKDNVWEPSVYGWTENVIK